MSNESHCSNGGQEPDTLVVGLGASAGGLEPLEQFFAHLPANTGLVFVVVQHLEPHRPSLLADLLSRHASVPVVEVADGMRPKADHVYVIAPGTLLSLQAGTFRVTPTDAPSPQRPIDILFRSLAAEKGERAVAIVFSGAGHDGTAGLRAIKERGGLTLAQAPGTARHDSMPQSAIQAGLVDHVLEPDRLAAKLLEHAGYVATAETSWAIALEPALAQSLGRVCALIRQYTGHDFASYKEGPLLRRIRRRMQVLHVPAVEDYLELLEKDAVEADALVRDLLIGVTQFFRDTEAFQAVAQQAIPLVVQGKAEGPIRIWVAGCASGEEAYSIAILVREHLERLGINRFVQIFATDLDAEMLSEARQGWYPLSMAELVGPERLARFFVREGERYQAAKELRDMCIFSQHSVIRDPPFSQLDLISCRNVLIYLSAELQKKIVPLFHYALRPGGFLFLGSSESIAGSPELFETLDKKHRLFRRKESVARPYVDFPLSPRSAMRSFQLPPTPAVREQPSLTLGQKVSASFERMLVGEYAVPSAVVNARGEIVLIAGKIGRFFEPPAGTQPTNLFDIAVSGLRLDLRLAVQTASKTRRKFVRDNVPVELEDGIHRVRLTVRPIPGLEPDAGLLAVVLQEHSPLDRPEETEAPEGLPAQPALEQLESELRTTRAELKTTVEDLESANEELKSSNEELISTNEELQSANEELQTSKEELQSLNEELETVNTELRQKVDELGIANSDLSNFFASTEVATIFLDRDLRLVKFTPAATDLFHLREGDIGRPIADFAPRFDGQDVVAEARDVLRTLKPVERQVRTADEKTWFILRVLPYRTVDNAIAGVVVTFVDVTELKQAEEATRQSQALVASLSETAPDPLYVKDRESRLLLANPATLGVIGRPAEQVIGKNDREIYDDPNVGEAILANDRRIMDSGVAEVVEERVQTPSGYRVFLSTKAPRRDADGKVIGLVGVSRDITERKQMEEALRESEERFRLLVEGVKDYAIFMLAPDGTVATWNAGAERLKGYRQEEILGHSFARFYEDQDAQAGRPARNLETAVRQGKTEDEGWRVRKDGTRFWANVLITAVRDQFGSLRGFAKVTRDFSERKRAEEALRASEDRFRTMANAIPQLAWVANADGFISWYNERWYEYTGATPEQMEGWGWQRVHDPEALPRVLERWKASLTSGEPFEMVFPLRGADGRFRSFLTRVQPLKDSEGRVQQWFGTNTDVSEIEQVRETLRESEERLRAALEGGHLGTWDLDLTTNIAVRSTRHDEIWGFNEPQPHWTFEIAMSRVVPEDRPAIEAAYARGLESGFVSHENRIVWDDGSVHWIAANGRVRYDQEGRAIRVTGVVADVTDRKRAEDAVRLSEARLRAALSAACMVAWEFDPETKNVTFSDNLEEVLDLPRRHETSDEGYALIHPYDVEHHRARVTEAIAGGGSYVSVYRHPHPESVIWLEEHGRAVVDATGKTVRLVGVVQNITERKRAEEALRASEERLRLAQVAGRIGTFEWNVQSGVNTWSPELEAMYGLRPGDFKQTQGAWEEMLHPEDRADAVGAVEKAFQTGEPGEAEFRVVWPDESVHWLTGRWQVLKDEQGKPLRLTGVNIDVTDRKAAEAALRRSEERLRLAQQAARIGAFEWDLREDRAIWSPELKALYGVQSATISGRHEEWTRLVHPDDLREVECRLRESLDAGRLDMEHRIVWPDGTIRWVTVLGQVFKDDAGKPVRMLGVNLDITERKRAEEALRRSDARMRAVIQSLAEGIVFIDREYKVQVVNEASERMGFTLEFLTNPDSDPRFRIVRSDGAPLPVEEQPAVVALRTGQPVRDFEMGVLNAHGELRWVLQSAQPVQGEGGEIVGAVASFFDITERKRAEEALRQSEERFRVAQELSPDGFLIYRPVRDSAGVVTDFLWMYENDAAARMNDTNPKEVCGRLLSEVLPHHHESPFHKAYGEVAETGEVRVIEEGFYDQDTFQQRRWFRVVAVPTTGRDVAVLVQDVTARKAAEEELRNAEQAVRRSREGLERLAEASLDVIGETDLDGMLQAIAQAALVLTGARNAVTGHGYVRGQFTIGGSARTRGASSCPPGKTFFMEKGGVYVDLVEGTADSIRMADEQMRAHARWWGLPEDHIPMRGLLGARMKLRQGATNGMILVTDKEHGDFTEEDESLLRQLATVASLALQHVETRISLEEADRSKNQFLAMLSHELRNPLAPIRNSLYVLDRAKPGGEQARRAQLVIDRQVGHLTRLVDDLLDVTRISRGKIQLQRERLELCDLVRRAVEDYRDAFSQAQLALDLSLPKGAIWVNADRTRIAQVVGNLLGNSAKFTPAGGKATVSLECNEDLGQAVLKVRDTGIGIAPEMLPRVFEPFAQADTTLDRSRGGLGLGLAMVKGLVEMHGGTASVESAGLGKGADFAVRIPLEKAEPAAEGPVRRHALDGGPRRVLVIEDNVDAAVSLREVLELGEHTVEVAFSGSEGLEKARKFGPDVVLCDIGLPGMNGYEVARAMRSDPALRGARLVALTGYAAPEDIAKARDAGFDAHLAKPPSPEKIAQALGAAHQIGADP